MEAEAEAEAVEAALKSTASTSLVRNIMQSVNVMTIYNENRDDFV